MFNQFRQAAKDALDKQQATITNAFASTSSPPKNGAGPAASAAPTAKPPAQSNTPRQSPPLVAGRSGVELDGAGDTTAHGGAGSGITRVDSVGGQSIKSSSASPSDIVDVSVRTSRRAPVINTDRIAAVSAAISNDGDDDDRVRFSSLSCTRRLQLTG